MRAVELAKVAATAEALRLRRFARRQGLRVIYGAVAAVFAVAVLVLLHVVIFQALNRWLPPWASSLVVLGIDLVMAGIFGGLALSGAPDAIEEEARQVRQQAVIEMRKSLTVLAVAGEVAGVALRRRAGSTGASLIGRTVARMLGRR